MVVLTPRGERVADADDAIDDVGLAQSPVLAAARTIAMELPELQLQLVDCDTEALDRGIDLLAVVCCGTGEDGIAIRQGKLFAFTFERAR